MFFISVIFIFLCFAIIIGVAVSKMDSTPVSSPAQPAQTTPSPVKQFDENNPLEIIHLAYALGTVIACMPRSRMYVVLQNENPDKGWPQCVKISAYIYGFDRDFPDQSFSHFIKWGLSESEAAYLASVPFEIQGQDVTYTFKSKFPQNPASLKTEVAEAMERGIRRSHLITHTDMTYTIDTTEASVRCSISS